MEPWKNRNVSLLRKQLDIVNGLPKEYVFLNYLRCHDDIGWGLDYDTLHCEGMEERSHKQYLNRYFQGYEGESNSRGVLYNDDPVTGDARFCATTASMCGIEKAGFEQDDEAMEKAMKLIGIFNFSEYDKAVQIQEEDGEYTELISGQKMKLSEMVLPAYGFYYLFKSCGE